jgi:hypothetical protein
MLVGKGAREDAMEERRIGFGENRPVRLLTLECGSRRYPIVSCGPESCLIEAADGSMPRGLVDIFDGERHVAHCLIVLAAPEGPFLRCVFKRRTAPRLDPPRDFAG